MARTDAFRGAVMVVAPVPSDVITIAANGWWRYWHDPDFVVDMSTFGAVGTDGVCHGCLATCTLQELIGERFGKHIIESEVVRCAHIEGLLGISESYSVLSFELAIDELRTGSLFPLFRWYGLDNRTIQSAFRSETVITLLDRLKSGPIEGSEEKNDDSWNKQLKNLKRLAEALAVQGV